MIYRQRSVQELIQVSVSIEDKKTRNREIRGLITATRQLKATKLTIITMNEEETIETEGVTINVKPVIKWMLED